MDMNDENSEVGEQGADDREEIIGGEDRGDVVAGEDPPAEAAQESEPKATQSEARAEEAPPAMIPRARLNEVIAQREEAEARAAQFEAALRARDNPPPQEKAHEFDFEGKEAEAAQAIIDGDMEAYRAIRAEIRAADREAVGREAEARAWQAMNQRQQQEMLVQEKQVFTVVAQDAVKFYPFLDAETGDPDAIKEVIEYRDFLIAKGTRPAQALADAVNRIAPLHLSRLGMTVQAAAAPPTGTADPRKAAAVARNVAAANAQAPIPAGGIGERATAGRLNVEKMSDEQFKSLSEEEKKRLRGD